MPEIVGESRNGYAVRCPDCNAGLGINCTEPTTAWARGPIEWFHDARVLELEKRLESAGRC